MGVRWEEQVDELTGGRGLEPWRRGEWGWKAGGDFSRGQQGGSWETSSPRRS